VHEHDQTQSKSGRPSKPQETAAPSIASQIGNAGVARLVQGQGVDRSGGGPAALDTEIARAIDQQRGGGRELDTDARAKLEGAMSEDFSDVRIHSDAEAHELSKAVSAEAFTTGSDVFFQSGKYDPGSSEGQKLLAHELTHVSQQRGAAPASEMTVSDPGDASEVEASAVADRVSSAPPSASPAGAVVSRAAEEEELQMSRVDRAAPEGEELQMSRVDRAAPEEEEPLQG
jgi:uncharacterized protein DUF4157